MFFGANDLCSGQCYDKDGTTPLQHSKKLQKALDYLQAKLPRTFVNLVPVLGECTTDYSISILDVCYYTVELFNFFFFCTVFEKPTANVRKEESFRLLSPVTGFESGVSTRPSDK